MGKEIDIDKEKTEDTKIVIKVKHLLWGFGILLSTASTILGYFHNQAMNTIKSVKDEQEKIKDEDKKWKETKFDPHLKEAADMAGDIKVILDRTNSRYRDSHSTGSNDIKPEIPTE